jgi:hypothetical protein
VKKGVFGFRPFYEFTNLRMKDRQDLIEDATDRLIQWLAVYQPEKEHDGLNPAG